MKHNMLLGLQCNLKKKCSKQELSFLYVDLLFLIAYAECKLSRPGPPATIVTIDEESPNGMYQTLAHLSSSFIFAPIHSVFHNGKCFCTQVAWIALLGLFLFYSECCFGNAIHINTSPAGIVHCFGVIEYCCSADGSWGRLVIRDVLSDILHCHFDFILN